MVPVISVDDYPLTLRIQKWVFSGCTVLPDSNETELRSSDQEASPSAGKNIVCMEVCPYSYFQWCGYF